MAYYRNTLEKNYSTGLGSSNSCLDGVPFKIGNKFCPPPRMILPPELKSPTKSGSLADDYLFETEEAVLAWAKAREEAKEAFHQAEIDRVGTVIEEFTQGPGPDRTSSSDSDATSDSENVSYPITNPNPTSVSSDINSSFIPQPLMANLSDNILTPVPITLTNQSCTDEMEKTSKPADFDLALFEKEDDPFDDMMLKTLDDMEELKTLLGTSQVANKGLKVDVNNSCSSDTNAAIQPAELCDGPQTSENRAQNRLVKDISREDSPIQTFSLINKPAVEEGDYVQLRPDYDKDAVLYKPENSTQVPTKLSSQSNNLSYSNILGGQLPPTLAESKIYKAVLPPIPNRAEFSKPLSNGAGIGLNNLNQDTEKQVVAVTEEKLSNLHKYSRHSVIFSPFRDLHNGESGDSTVNLRNAKSNPDISQSYSQHKEQNSPLFPVSQSPPLRPPSQQPWNPFRPLPPTPTPSPVPVVKSQDSVASSSSNSSTTSGLLDNNPYTSMSLEAQQFVDNLVSMGFTKARVARAVQKLGQDAKEVIDHLFSVDMLSEKGFNPLQAESALHLYDNDVNKAERYLGMFYQFQELGFDSEKIREALVTNDMDRDKALDYLMS